MKAAARLRFLRMSPNKVRLVVDAIRGSTVAAAEERLTFMNKAAAQPVLKLMKSAIANAENNFKLSKDNLYINEIFVDEGPMLKRWRARAFGRAAEIRKRSSHITIVLDELKKSTAKKKAKGTKAVIKEKAEEKKKPVTVKQPVVDFQEVKRESKFKTGEEKHESPVEEKKKPLINFKKIKDKFTRRLGER